MALITRFSRLFAADVHALLDRLEAPDVVLKQAIREMEDALAARAARIDRLDAETEQLSRQQSRVERSLREIGEQLDVCFAASDETLARPLVRRRLEFEQLLERIVGRRDSAVRAAANERARSDEERREFERLQQQVEVVVGALAASSPEQFSPESNSPITDADVEVALLREKRLRGRA